MADLDGLDNSGIHRLLEAVPAAHVKGLTVASRAAAASFAIVEGVGFFQCGLGYRRGGRQEDLR